MIPEYLKKFWGYNKMKENCTNHNHDYKDANEFVDALDRMHRSAGYKTIRDGITQQMLDDIKKDPELYKKFQSIKQECKESFDYDNRAATMLDVNRGLTNLYKIILQLISAQRRDGDDTFTSICGAINKIEEKLGMEQTDWFGGMEDVADDTIDVEGIETDSK